MDGGRERVRRKIFCQFYLAEAASLLLLAALDQATKYLAAAKLAPEGGGVDFVIWDGVFRLHYLENRGMAFGLLQGGKIFFVAMTAVIAIAICWVYRRIPRERCFLPLRALCVTVLAGAMGNFIDRVRLNYVVDFFYFELIDFPVFNVADIYVTCSVFLFIALFLFYYKEEDLMRIWPGWRKET